LEIGSGATCGVRASARLNDSAQSMPPTSIPAAKIDAWTRCGERVAGWARSELDIKIEQ
jgi:hypothetical protein